MKKRAKTKNLKFNDGKWYVDFTFNKKRIRKFGGYTKEQAMNTLTKLRMEKLNEKLGFKKPERKPDIPFELFSEEFMELYSRQNKKSWKRDEASLKHLNPFFKEKTLQEIKPELVANYKLKRKADITPRKTPVEVATINREISLLKTMFNWAEKYGKIDRNPIAKVEKFPEREDEKRKKWKILENDEDAIRLIDSAIPHLKPILIIALNTGMRKGEILSLKWKNIDFKEGLIFIEDSKAGKSRKVPMNYNVFEALKEYPRNSEFVFYNSETNSHIKDVKRSFKTACNKASIKDMRFHDLRHTAASKMVNQAGVDLVTASKILGHSSIQMTVRYVHSTTKVMRQAVDGLGEIYMQIRQKVENPTVEATIKKSTTHLFLNN